MKKSYALVLIVCNLLLASIGTLQAQAPQGINYQAVARDDNGTPLADRQISVRIAIRELTAEGTASYVEVHNDISTNPFGLFTLEVGSGTPQTGTFTGVDWGNGAKFFQVEFDPDGGSSYIDMGTSQLLSVPYALYATSASYAETSNISNSTLNDLGDVNTAGATNGQVLMWNGSQWVPGTLPESDPQTLSITGTQLSISGGNTVSLPAGGSADNWGTQTVESDATLSGQGTTVDRLRIAQQGATNGQVLKWNGTSWAPAADANTDAQTLSLSGNTLSISGGNNVMLPAGTTYTAGTGISIAGNVITNTGDTNAADDITTTSQAGGDITGTFSNLQIAPGSVGSAEIANGSITAADLAPGVVPASIPPNGAAGGDLTGTYPNPAVANNAITTSKISDDAVTTAKINNGAVTGTKIAQAGATNGQVLKWNGTTWAPAADAGGTNYTAGTGISIAGNTITNTGDTNAADDITNTSQAGGDITGTFSNLQIAPGSVGSAEIANGSITAADLAPGVIPASIPPGGAAGGDLTGTYPNPTVTNNAITTAKINNAAVTDAKLADNAVTTAKINNTAVTEAKIANNAVTTGKINDGAVTGTKIAQAGATNGQVLKWNGTTWAPAADAGGTTYTAGTGISIAGNVITNTGDTNAADDITTTSQAGGDITGTFSNLQIAPGSVGSAEIANGSITAADLAPGVVPPSLPPNGTAGGDLTGTYPNPTVANNAISTSKISDGAVTGAKIAQGGATNGQVLKWNGTTWAPAADAGGTNYTAGTGISLAGNVITNTGDTNPADDITNTTVAGGDLTGTYPNPTVANNAITTAKINNTAVTEAKIANNAVTTGKISDGAVTTIKVNDGAITGTKIAQGGATNGQVLKWNGTTWAPAADAGGTTYTAGTGISLAGNTITNTGDTNPADDITNTTAAGGDLTGTYPNPTVANNAITTAKINNTAVTEAKIADNAVTTAKINDGAVTTAKVSDAAITGAKIAQAGATNGQVLKWNGTTWAPAADAGGTSYTAGTGISLAGNVITNTGDTNPADDITNTTAAGGDLTGTYPNPTVANNAITTAKINNTAVTEAKLANNAVTTAKINDGAVTTAKVSDAAITGTKIAQGGATNGQVLKWNGTTWAPAADAGGTNYTAGTGISLAGNVITNTGDTNPADDITNTTAAGGDLTGTYPNPTVANNAITTAKINNTAVTEAKIADNAVTTGKINNGAVTGAKIAQSGATNGQVLKWNGTTWAPAADNSTDNDSDPTNEIQQLTRNGDTLFLSNGGGNVILPPSGGGTQVGMRTFRPATNLIGNPVAPQSIPVSAPATVNFYSAPNAPGISFNVGGGSWSTANQTYTVPETGYYFLTASADFQMGTDIEGPVPFVLFAIQNGGTDVLSNYRHANWAERFTISVTGTLYLTAGAVLRVQCTSDEGGTIRPGGTRTFFSCMKMF